MTATMTSSGMQMAQIAQRTGQQISQNITNGIRAGVGSARGAMQAMMHAIQAVGIGAVGTMRHVGNMIGQGLAQGMYSALGAVTAAANALVAQAERAAQAKAKIHSPSRLFRDNIGKFLALGVADGIDRNASEVSKSMENLIDDASQYTASNPLGSGFDYNGVINHEIKEADNQNKPMQLTLELGGRAFSAFVEDITTAQGKKERIRLKTSPL